MVLEGTGGAVQVPPIGEGKGKIKKAAEVRRRSEKRKRSGLESGQSRRGAGHFFLKTIKMASGRQSEKRKGGRYHVSGESLGPRRVGGMNSPLGKKGLGGLCRSRVYAGVQRQTGQG